MAQHNYGFSTQDQSGFATQQSQQHSYNVQQQYEVRQQYSVTQQSDGFAQDQLSAQDQSLDDDRYATDGPQYQQQQTDLDLGTRYATQGHQRQFNGGLDIRYSSPPAQQQEMGTIENKQHFEARRNAPPGQRRQFAGFESQTWQPKVAAEKGGKSQDSTDAGQAAVKMAMTEDEYREWLTTNFKHSFEKYEAQGGMPIAEFQEMVKNSDLGRSHNLKGLFAKLDKDGNNRVSWNEFFTGMKYTKKDEVGRSRKAVNSFISAMTPVANKKIRKEKQAAAEEGEPIPEESYLEAYNCRPPPLFIPIFYIVAWIFFIVYAVQMQDGPEWNRVGWQSGFPYISPFVFCPSIRHEAWRFVTYALLHRGYHHIVFNTVFSLLLGIPLETVHKFWRVGPVFFIGILLGSLACSIADPSTALVGASGGVYALIGAHYALIVMNWEELQEGWTNIRENPLRFLMSGVMRLVYLTLLVAIDFGMAFYERYYGDSRVNVSISAHAAGLLAGLFAGVPILRNIDKKPWEGIAFIICLVVTILMILFGIIWNLAYQGFPARESIVCSNLALIGLPTS